MYRPIFCIVALLIASSFAQLSPTPESSIAVPYGADDGVSTLVVTDNWVLYANERGDGTVNLLLSGTQYLKFTNEEFVLGECDFNFYLFAYNDTSVIVICDSYLSGTSDIEVRVFDLGITDELEIVILRNNTFTGLPSLLTPSSHAFVTLQGSIFLYAKDNSGDYYFPSLYRFDVNEFVFYQIIADMTEGIDACTNGMYVYDIHSLPFDDGAWASVECEPEAYSPSNMYAFYSVNGTSSTQARNDTYYAAALGRKKGSSFGYAMINDVNDETTCILQAWDLSRDTPTNFVTSDSTRFPYSGDTHFATDDAVFVFTTSDEFAYISMVPYSENGFLPQISATTVQALDGTFIGGTDDTYVYALATINEDDSYTLSRWTY